MLTIYKDRIFTEGIESKYDKYDANFGYKRSYVNSKIHSEKLQKQNIYYNEMKPLLILLRMAGRFPYSFTKTGFVPFSFTSWPFLYSIAFTIVFNLLTAKSIEILIIDKIYPSQSYDEAVFWFIPLLFELQTFLGPIAFWWDAPRIVRYFQNWKEFEELWVLGDMYSVKRIRCIRIFSVTIIPFCFFYTVQQSIIVTKISIQYFLPHIPIILGLTSTMLHWWVTLNELSQYSDRLLINMFKLKDRRDVGYRRRIWLRISSLMMELGNATGASGMSHFVTNFLGFTLSSYSVLIRLLSPSPSNVSLFALILIAFSTAFNNFVIAEAAYRAMKRVGPRFTRKLLEIDLTTLHRNALCEIDLMFNCLLVKFPVIGYLGYMKISRSMFLQFVFSTVTYLIVLVQMKVQPKHLKNNTFHQSDGNSTVFEEL